MKKFNIMAVLLLFSISVLAIVPPDNVQATFKKMYPKTNDIAWSQDDGYYCANFVMNGFTKNVWFNAQGQWEMTQTDLVSLDRLTPVVYNAFTFSSYAAAGADKSAGCTPAGRRPAPSLAASTRCLTKGLPTARALTSA